jgi:integrase
MGYSVAMLVSEFWKCNRGRYYKNGRKTSEHASYKVAFKPVLELYGDRPTAEFGPKALIACRQVLVDKGYCRKRINGHIYRIRRVWKWGVSREIVPETTWRALLSVECLKYGEAPDPAPVRPIPLEYVEAIKPKLSRQVKAMVELQLLSGARPGEICSMRSCDLIPGEVWRFVPGSHKTEHHGKRRVILLGPKCQEILKPFLKPDLQANLFSPAEARREWSARVTKRPGRRRRVLKPLRRPGEAYTTGSYGHAIQKACRKAGVPVWSPNRLRHSSGTKIRELYGVEAAQIILGHSSMNTTEIYAERDYALAAKVAREIG